MYRDGSACNCLVSEWNQKWSFGCNTYEPYYIECKGVSPNYDLYA